MIKRFSILFVLLLSACATATKINTGGEQQSYLIGCHGMALSMEACFEKANDVCPKGYTPVAVNGEAYPIATAQGTLSGSQAPNNSAWLQAQQTQVAGAVIYRYLTVQCK